MTDSTVGFSHGLRHGLRTYYFRKLAKYLNGQEYRNVEKIRASTNPQTTIPELLFLRWAIRRCRPETVVEIGSFCGASTSLMADMLKRLGKGRIYAIDLFSQSRDGIGHGGDYWKTFDQAMQPYAGSFEKITGDSKVVPWNQSIDFLYIDGDHSDAGASADIAKFTPFVRTGGYVFLHDYLDVPEDNSMVKSAVDRTLTGNPAYRLLGLVTSLIGFQKVKPRTQPREMITPTAYAKV